MSVEEVLEVMDLNNIEMVGVEGDDDKKEIRSARANRMSDEGDVNVGSGNSDDDALDVEKVKDAIENDESPEDVPKKVDDKKIHISKTNRASPEEQDDDIEREERDVPSGVGFGDVIKNMTRKIGPAFQTFKGKLKEWFGSPVPPQQEDKVIRKSTTNRQKPNNK